MSGRFQRCIAGRPGSRSSGRSRRGCGGADGAVTFYVLLHGKYFSCARRQPDHNGRTLATGTPRVKTRDATTDVVRDSPDRDTCGARLAAVLRASAPAGYCVDCLAVKLNLSAHEVRGAAQVLVARPGFRVVKLACYTCGSLKDDVVNSPRVDLNNRRPRRGRVALHLVGDLTTPRVGWSTRHPALRPRSTQIAEVGCAGAKAFA
jgi:hypothetical protein